MTFFSRQAQTLQHAAHSGHTDLQPPLPLELSTKLCQGSIGLGLDHLPHESQSCGVAARLAAAGMGARRNVPCGAPSL